MVAVAVESSVLVAKVAPEPVRVETSSEGWQLDGLWVNSERSI